METSLRVKSWGLLAVIGLLAVLQIAAPSQIWVTLLVGLSLLQAIAFLWAKSLAGNFRLQRERRYTWAQVGDRMEERFTLTNGGIAPATWVEIIDHSTLPGYTASRVTGLGSRTSNRWTSDGVCARRGVFQLGPTDAILGDPFGLFEVRQHYPITIDLMVVPPVLPLPGLDVAAGGQFGDRTSRAFSFNRTQIASAVRPLQPGDTLSDIHWPTTARRDDFYVKRRGKTAQADWCLLLDLHAAIHHGSGDQSTLEKAILIAASLADRGLRNHHAVGLLAQGQETVWLSPQQVALQRWRISRALARAQPGDMPLSQLLSRGERLLNRQTSSIIITASADTHWLDTLLQIRRRAVIPTAILLHTPRTRADMHRLHNLLQRAEVTSHLIAADSIVPPTPEDAAGQWQWHITGTGKAIAIQKPRDSWKQVA